jgi:hypothetical protein
MSWLWMSDFFFGAKNLLNSGFFFKLAKFGCFLNCLSRQNSNFKKKPKCYTKF